MTRKPFKMNTRHWAKPLLLLLVTISFLPEMVIWVTAGFARLMGCQPGQKDPCLGSLTISNIIDQALQVSAGFIVTHVSVSERWMIGFYLAIAVWLVACYAVVMLGWSRVSSRLVLGCLVALVFSVLPFLGPGLAILGLAERGSCQPSVGSDDPCKIFGGEVSQANAAVSLTEPNLQFGGALLAIGIFVVYAMVVIATALQRGKARHQVN